MKLPSRKKLSLILVLALLFAGMPLFQARAVDLFGIDSIASSAVQNFLWFFFSYIFSLLGDAIAIMAKALYYTVNIRVGADIPVVSATWKIFRDFANLIFIVLLIYMAFATIFDWSKYRFKDMFWRFLIVAVFINFSLTIGNFVIDLGQVLTNLFLGSIGDIGVRLGQYLSPASLIPGPNQVPTADLFLSSLVSLLFSFSLFLIIFFSLLTAFIFTFIRVPYIWGLLIVAPFYWMGNMFPASKYNIKQWWNQLLGWNLFLPVYLFFLYIGLYFLSKRDEIIDAVVKISNGGASPLNQPIIGGVEKSLTFNLLFFYIFAAALMIGGVAAAIASTKMISGSDAFIKKGYDKARSWAGKISGYDVRQKAIQAAATAKLGEFQQRGFQNPYLNKIYGGKDADERIKARYMDRARVGERNAVEKQVANEITTAKGKMRNLNSNELQARVNSGTTAQKLAARELLKERNQLNGAEILNTYRMYGGDRTESGRKFLSSVDFAKLSSSERTTIFREATDPQVKQKIAGVMAEKGNMGASHPDKVSWLLANARELYAQPSEKVDFIQKAEKEDFMATIEAKADLASHGEIEIRDGARIVTSPADILRLRIQRMKPDALAEVDTDSWSNRDFFRAVQNKIRAFQAAQPPVAANPGPPPVPPKPGGGDTFKANIIKDVTDTRKLAIINRLRP